MAYNLVPQSFWTFPSMKFPSLWDEDDDWDLMSTTPSGLSISEDEKKIYVSAAVPGVDPKDVEVTFHKGVLWIKGEAKEEEQKKKYYRKATSSFSYRVAVPGDVDPKAEPQASVKYGIMTVAFAKSPAAQPKKIAVKPA